MKLFSIIGVILMLSCMALCIAATHGIESDVPLEAEMGLVAVQPDSPVDALETLGLSGYAIFYGENYWQSTTSVKKIVNDSENVSSLDVSENINGIISGPGGYVIFYNEHRQSTMIIVIKENWKNISCIDMSDDPHLYGTRRNPMLC